MKEQIRIKQTGNNYGPENYGPDKNDRDEAEQSPPPPPVPRNNQRQPKTMSPYQTNQNDCLLLTFFQPKLLILIPWFTIVAACGNKEGDSSPQVVEHPIEENIPYFDRDHIEINRSEAFQVSDGLELPESIHELQRYLKDPASFEHRELDILVSAASQTFITSPAPNQLVILNRGSDRLEQYDLKTDSTITVAPQGQGPGDIAYPIELIEKGEAIYVAMEDMRISRFDCSPVCDYEETITLEFSPLSLAVNNRQFAVVAHTPYWEKR